MTKQPTKNVLTDGIVREIKPYCCPVCIGRGNVSHGFYNYYNLKESTSTVIDSELCRTCNGTGIVWNY